MPDGVRLAADLYRPADLRPGERLPVILEYLPYRLSESRSHRYGLFAYFVARGYVVARVDIRGTGLSEGRLVPYEYSEREQADGEAVIDWLSRQGWSNGNVGMMGISWGGFNSIHMAMRRPPALKAIVALAATDDIYEDDVHFTDGIMHADAYEMRQDLDNAIPGAPDYRIDEAYFANRFDTEPWFLVYKSRPLDGPFWNRASLNADYGAIRIPVFVIGGWYDGYRDSVPRMLERLSGPVKAMVGPWAHTFPNWGFPGESIEWRREVVRWFDHWLLGRENGILDEPRFAVFVREWHPPGLDVDRIAGSWRWEEGWPIGRGRAETLFLRADRSLARAAPAPGNHALAYRADVGVEAAGSVMWWGDLQEDQRPVDTFSLVYETAPLEQPVEILGFPTAHLNAAADVPLAHWVARLSDVAPDGRVTLITGAALNGAHRDSAERPSLLEPGREYPLTVEMHFTSWIFPAGHRIRLAVNNAMWPMFWPTPYPMVTTLRLGGEPASRLVLPVVPAADRPRPQFAEVTAEEARPPGFGDSQSETKSGYAEIASVTRDLRRGVTRLVATNSGRNEYPWGRERYTDRIVHQVSPAEPARARVESEYTTTVELPNRTLVWTGLLEFASDRSSFHYRYTRRLEIDGGLVRERSWERILPRGFH